jgi:1-acyl-sn-glycerol-3-phosphate acyltransferase
VAQPQEKPPGSGRRGFFAFWSDALFWAFQKVVWLVFKLYFRFQVTGEIPSSGPLLIASNHTSFLDSFWVGAASSRRIRFLMSDLYGKIFGLRWFFRWNKVILVPEEGGLRDFMVHSVEALKEGDGLGIFPEGWITKDGSLREFQTGVIRLAMKTRAKIVPIAIVGGAEAYPRGAWIPRPKKVKICIGDPVGVESLLPREGTRAEKMRVAAAALREMVLRLKTKETLHQNGSI